MSPSQGRSLSRSPVTRGGNEVDEESSWFAAVRSISSPLGNTIECETYENDRRTPPPRSSWNVNAWLDRFRLLPNARRDDTAFDLESSEQTLFPTSPIEEVAISQDDIVIVLVGLTGSGKTTFIDRAVGRPDVGCRSTSSTKEVCPVRYPHPDGVRNVVLVDTPGFDDTFASDAQILGKIAQWLTLIYIENIKLNGILYFHPISDNRVLDASARTFNVLKELCGRDNFKNVIFVTTMWDEVSEEIGSAREQELQSNFWRVMISLGSTTHRFEGTTESAWKIINSMSISQLVERRPLQIQREMVDEHVPFHRTAAGRALLESLTTPMTSSKGIFKRFKRGTRRTSPRTSHSTSITVTLTDIPTDTPSVGTGIVTFSNSGLCSAQGYRNSLVQAIPALQAAAGAAELGRIHYLKDAVASCLSVSLSIETMAGTHHALFRVVETATLLINVVVEVAKETTLSADIQAAVTEFAKKMNHMQEIIQDFAQRTPEARRILRSTDVHILSSCANSMRVVCDVLRSTSSIKHDLRSVDDGLGAVKRGLEIGDCSCGIPIKPE